MESHPDLLRALEALNSPDVWLIVAGIGVVAILASVLVIGRRVNHVWEELLELGQLHRGGAREDDYPVAAFVPAPAVSELPPAEPSVLPLHLQQIKRQQLLVLDELRKAQSATQAVAELTRQLATVERRQSQLLEALAHVSAEVQRWNARLTALGIEAAPLLESEAIADFVTHVEEREAPAASAAGGDRS
ncbi:MAG TPA: hypothetical protein VML56_03910 [Burkholderiales bacterium]|nr:hypothetical protein [Burkholderiales bacterium]